MNLKELRDTIKRLKDGKGLINQRIDIAIDMELKGMKEIVDVVNNELWGCDVSPENIKIWREIVYSLSKTKT